MTRAVLVAGVIATTASLPVSAALGAPKGSTFVVRGVVVQYIPPSGSIVGSLSVRVVKVGSGGRALLGELVTVAVERRDAPKTGQPLQPKSIYTLTLHAPSPASILKGAADVRSIVPSAPPAQAPAPGATAGTTQPTNPDAPAKNDATGSTTGGSTDHGSTPSPSPSQSTDSGSGKSGDHGSGKGNDQGNGDNHGSGSPGKSGSSNGHK